MSIFSKWLGEKTALMSASEQRDAIINILLYTMRIDNGTHEDEASHIMHILARRYELEEEAVRQKMIGAEKMNISDVETLAGKLCDNITYDERVLLLRDICAVAFADDDATRTEEAVLHRVAKMLEIPNNDFFNKCIKGKRFKRQPDDVREAKRQEDLQAKRQEDAIIGILLYTTCVDRQAHKDEINRMVNILARRYQRDKEEIRRKIKEYKRMKWSDFEALTRELCDYLDSEIQRIQILRDIWAIAMEDGVAGRSEQAVLNRVAEILEISPVTFSTSESR